MVLEERFITSRYLELNTYYFYLRAQTKITQKPQEAATYWLLGSRVSNLAP